MQVFVGCCQHTQKTPPATRQTGLPATGVSTPLIFFEVNRGVKGLLDNAGIHWFSCLVAEAGIGPATSWL